MNEHSNYIRRCLDLAQNASGTSSPNPMVGCVIVHKNKIIGEGWHKMAGESHAEVNAINSVRNQALLKQATIYVSLEPCSHFGKTPPCADLVIEKEIPRVVIGTSDPHQKVGGKGIGKLKAAGVEVIFNVLVDECRTLNKKFFVFHEKQRPFITLKWAKSQDGFIDKKREKGEKGSFGISGPQSRVFVHKLRAEHDAILIGPRTAYIDNPKLSSRWYAGKSPVRLVLDRFGKLPNSLLLFSDDFDTWQFTTVGKASELGNKKKIILTEDNFIEQLLEYAYQNGIQSVLVEGGAVILNYFINAGLWDEIVEIKSNKTLGEGLVAPKICSGISEFFGIGNDEISIYKNNGLPIT